MKICYVATSVHLSNELNDAIGASTHTYALAKEFTKLGHEVNVICERKRGDEAAEEIDGIAIYRLKRAIVTETEKIKKSKLRPLLKKFRPISTLLLGLKIARIVKQKNCDLIFERAQSRGAAAIASLLTGKPLFVEVIDNLFSNYSLRKAEKIFAYTDCFFNDTLKRKVVLVNAAVDLRLFKPVKVGNEFDLCYCGAFKGWDGVEDLAMATKLVKEKKPGIKVLLIGEGLRLNAVRKLVKENNLEKNFVFLGRIPLKKVAENICRAKICVAPFNIKNCSEGEFEKYGFYFSPLKIFEYLACGKPIVATDYPLIGAIVSHENGLLFEEGSPQQLAEKILQLLNAKNLKEIEKNNREKAKRYDWEKVAKKINDYFTNI